jgi:hypothetical protein
LLEQFSLYGCYDGTSAAFSLRGVPPRAFPAYHVGTACFSHIATTPGVPVPIQITCTTCGKKLQVGDQHAGKKVGCPGCRTVLVAPGTPVASSSPPPAPKAPAAAAPKAPAAGSGATKNPSAPAAKPAAPKAAAPAATKPAAKAAPKAAPPPEPESESEEEEPFSFGGKKPAKAEHKNEDEDEAPKGKKTAKKTEEDEDEPTSKKKETEEEPEEEDEKPKEKSKETDKAKNKAKKEPPKWKKRDADDASDAPTGRSKRTSDEPDEEKTPAASAWRSFGGGSALSKWGVWIELLGLACGLGVIGYITVGRIEDPRGTAELVQDLGGPFVFAPFFGIYFLGVLLTFMGRTRMLSIPSGTGVKKVFFGSWLFTFVQFLAAVAGVVFIVMSGLEWSDATNATSRSATRSNPGDYLGFAFLAYGISLPFWLLADLSIIPAIAVVGGAIPSLRLRRRVGTAVFGLQLLIVVEVAVGFFGGYTISDLENRRDRYEPTPRVLQKGGNVPPKGFGTDTLTHTRMPSSADEREKQVIIAVLSVILVAQFIYTILFAALYGAGRTAVRQAKEAEEAAEDADI